MITNASFWGAVSKCRNASSGRSPSASFKSGGPFSAKVCITASFAQGCLCNVGQVPGGGQAAEGLHLLVLSRIVRVV